MIVSCPFNRSFPLLLFLRELSGLFTPTFINYSCGVAGRRRSNEEGGERGSVAVGIVGQNCMESLSCSSFVSFTLSFLPPANLNQYILRVPVELAAHITISFSLHFSRTWLNLDLRKLAAKKESRTGRLERRGGRSQRQWVPRRRRKPRLRWPELPR